VRKDDGAKIFRVDTCPLVAVVAPLNLAAAATRLLLFDQCLGNTATVNGMLCLAGAGSASGTGSSQARCFLRDPGANLPELLLALGIVLGYVGLALCEGEVDGGLEATNTAELGRCL